MLNSTALILALVVSSALPAADELTCQCEKTRVTVLMCMLSPKQDAANPDTKGDATHRNCKCHGTMKVKSGDGLIEMPCPCGKLCSGKCGGGKKTALPPPTLEKQQVIEKLSEVIESPPEVINPEPEVIKPEETKPATQPPPEEKPKPVGMLGLTPAARIANQAKALNPNAKLPVRQLYVVGAKWCTYCPTVKAIAEKLRGAGWDVSDTDLQALIAIIDMDTQTSALLGHDVTSLPTVLVLCDGVVEQRLDSAEAQALNPFTMANLLLGKNNTSLEYLTPRGKVFTQKASTAPVNAVGMAPPGPGPTTTQNQTVIQNQPVMWYWTQPTYSGNIRRYRH